MGTAMPTNIIGTEDGRWRIHEPVGTQRVVDKLPGEMIVSMTSLFGGTGSGEACKTCGKTREWHTKEGGGPNRMRVKHKFVSEDRRT